MNNTGVSTLTKLGKARRREIDAICQKYAEQVAPIVESLVAPLFVKYPEAHMLEWRQGFGAEYDAVIYYVVYGITTTSKDGDVCKLGGSCPNRSMILCAHALRDTLVNNKHWLELSKWALGESTITVTPEGVSIAAYAEARATKKGK